MLSPNWVAQPANNKPNKPLIDKKWPCGIFLGAHNGFLK